MQVNLTRKFLTFEHQMYSYGIRYGYTENHVGWVLVGREIVVGRFNSSRVRDALILRVMFVYTTIVWIRTEFTTMVEHDRGTRLHRERWSYIIHVSV